MIDAAHLKTWIGREQSERETLAVETLVRLAALLDYPKVPWPAGQLPTLGHWLYFLPRARASEIAVDGHPRLGGFLPAAPVATVDALPAFDWQREVQPDPMMLLRFSALTFNAHRIHFDRDYARQEGYAGLVVHGPLTASLLMDLFVRHHPTAHVVSFSFRGHSPLLDTAPFTLAGRATGGGAELYALDSYGRVAMSATVEVR